MPQIEVTFDIDANGIVHVAAKDRATGKEQSMTITGQTALSAEEIQRMLSDAEAHAEEDRRRREEAEVRNTADALVYQSEALLRDQGDGAPAEDRQRVEDALRSLKEALPEGDVGAIRGGTEALSDATQRLTRRLYEQANGQAASAGAGSDDEIVDTEIVDERRSA